MASSIITVSGQKPLYLHIQELTEQDNRQLFSWIKKEDFIDLGNIKEIKEGHWTNRAIKQEKARGKKSITVSGSELVDFFRAAQAYFGIFIVRIGENDLLRYFFKCFDILKIPAVGSGLLATYPN